MDYRRWEYFGSTRARQPQCPPLARMPRDVNIDFVFIDASVVNLSQTFYFIFSLRSIRGNYVLLVDPPRGGQ